VTLKNYRPGNVTMIVKLFLERVKSFRLFFLIQFPVFILLCSGQARNNNKWDELEPFILQSIEKGDECVYLAAYLRIQMRLFNHIMNKML